MKELIKREIIYFYIKRPFTFLWLLFFNLIFLLAKGLTNVQEVSPSDPQYTFTRAFSLLIPLFIFAFTGGMSMDEIIHKDKVKKYFEVLMATGFSPFKILLGKIISLVFVLYFLFILSFLLWISLLITFGTSLDKIFFEGKLFWVNFLVFSPLLGVSLLVLESFFYLIFQDQRSASIFSFLSFGFLGFFILFIALASPYDFFLIIFLPSLSFFSLIFSFLFTCLILKLTPPERYLSKT